MSKPATTKIRSISVPLEIEERMAGHKNLNWSAIATAAFVKAMDDEIVIPSFSTDQSRGRLLMTLVERKSEKYQHGFKCGVIWARDDAALTELQNLRQLYQENGRDYAACVGKVKKESIRLAATITTGDADYDLDAKDLKSFWSHIFGVDYLPHIKSRETLVGMVHGSLRVLFATGLDREGRPRTSRRSSAPEAPEQTEEDWPEEGPDYSSGNDSTGWEE